MHFHPIPKKKSDVAISVFATIIISTIFLAFFTPFQAYSASNLIYESFVKTNPLTDSYLGSQPGEQFGAAIATGDVNGDEYVDMIVGSPFASFSDREWNGAISVILGNESSDDNQLNLRFYGANSGDQFGTSVAVGDYNNDGVDDIAVGAYNGLTEDVYNGIGYGIRAGHVYIIYGQSMWDSLLTSQEVDFGLNKPDVLLEGRENGDNFGLSLKTGDVNNDNIDDLLIGAPNASSVEFGKTGIVYAHIGGSDDLSERVLFFGQEEGERFGSSIGVGDVTGDSKNDILIGAYLSGDSDLSQSGKVYFYEGVKKFWASGVRNPNIVIEGTQNEEWFGFDVGVGDLNGDGYDDIAMSSFPYLDNELNGEVSVVYGGADFMEYGSTIFNNSEIVKTFSEEIYGDEKYGASLILEDLNNDGQSDISVGAPAIGLPLSTEAGSVYVYYSGSGGLVKSVIHGENPDDWFGYHLSAGDMNRSGFNDLIVGSGYSDGPESANNGKIFVLESGGVPIGRPKIVLQEGNFVSRGDFVTVVVDEFELKTKKAKFIENCYENRDFCFFTFSAKSKFDDISLTPSLFLYPDVSEGDSFYESVNIVTMLELMNGYLEEENSPFHPGKPVSRIQALKVILGAAELIEPKYKFQLSEKELGGGESYFFDVDGEISHMWWYPRYINFAVENGILDVLAGSDGAAYFRPDDNITVDELNDMVERTLDFLGKEGSVGENDNANAILENFSSLSLENAEDQS